MSHSTSLTTPPMEDAVLRVRGLTVSAQLGGQSSAVLRSLDFDVPKGRTLGLVGESGAGKSMLGRVLARQLPHGFSVTAGEVLFQGRDLLHMPHAQHAALLGRRIAFIPQEPMTALNPVRTIGDQFMEHLRHLGVPGEACRATALQALAEVRLPDPPSLLGRYAFQLSGGMCQRVMIAMAFAGNPELVISDEATTALDVSTQAHVVALLRRMQAERGTSVIFVTHDMGLATHVCDDIAVLYAGDAMELAPAKRLFASPGHPYTRALLQAVPELHGRLRELKALPGQMPGVSAFPSLRGCRFQPRCASATEACHLGFPPLTSIGQQHLVRCWHPQQPAVAVAPEAAATAAPPPGKALSGNAILRLQGVAKTYASGSRWQRSAQPVHALQGIDLQISPGEFVGVVGESGSGKSTLAKLVMGLEAPSQGEILLNDRPLATGPQEWARRISSIQMIFQDARSALNPRRRIGSLLTQLMDGRPVLHSERRSRALQLAADVGLAPDAVDRLPTQLSGGQRQRVNIGRALCDLPQLLVADEIVSGLDVSVQAQILHLLLALREEHKVALLLISHDLGVVRHLCSRVLVMHRGRVVESGDTEMVFANPQHAYTRALLAAVPSTDPHASWPPSSPFEH